MNEQRAESPYERVMRKEKEERVRWAKEVQEPAIRNQFGLIRINSRRYGVVKRAAIFAQNVESGKPLIPIAQYEIVEEEDKYNYEEAIKRVAQLNGVK